MLREKVLSGLSNDPSGVMRNPETCSPPLMRGNTKIVEHNLAGYKGARGRARTAPKNRRSGGRRFLAPLDAARYLESIGRAHVEVLPIGYGQQIVTEVTVRRPGLKLLGLVEYIQKSCVVRVEK